MDLPLQFEVGAHALTAVLGLWLGLTVVTRSGVPAARAFAVLALTLAAWSSTIIVGRLSAEPNAIEPARAVEELLAALALAGTAHFSLAIATDGHPSAGQRRVLAVVYVLLFAFALPTALNTREPIAIAPPHFGLGPVPGALLGWASIIVRLLALLTAVGWLVSARRTSASPTFRRRQLEAALATVVTGGVGAALRFLPVIGEADAWIGVSFVTLAVVLATYAVFSAGIFFGAAVASRAFRTSLLGGLTLVVLVAVLVLVDGASRTYLRLPVPLFTALGIVIAIALYEPAASAIRRATGRSGPRALARDRLLRALGQPTLTARPAAAGVQPALARLAHALDLTALTVVAVDGTVVAWEGAPVSAASIRPIRLVAGDSVLGELRVGRRASGAPFDSRDEELIELSASYVAAALSTSKQEDQQVTLLTQLADDRALVESQARHLHAALVGHREALVPLRVFALGPFRVERGDAVVERWGGDKAGTRQAQALFAFLFDRGERGLAKDEAIELIWPDVDLERADVAFHRTMRGLRATLDPGKAIAGGGVIRFVNDRYRLSPSAVGWSDIAAFNAAIDGGKDTTDAHAYIELLEEARRLYRGDYLDDCPFYGDSALVEPTRKELRERYVDLLVTLGQRYEALDDRLSAAHAFRQALERAPEGQPAAEEAIARLGS